MVIPANQFLFMRSELYAKYDLKYTLLAVFPARYTLSLVDHVECDRLSAKTKRHVIKLHVIVATKSPLLKTSKEVT